MNDLCACLLDDELSKEMTSQFVECMSSELKADHDRPDIQHVFTEMMRFVNLQNHETVTQFTESPIEKILFRSMVLAAVKSAGFIVVTQPYRDAAKERTAFREYLSMMNEFCDWYQGKHGTETGILDFIQNERDLGRMEVQEYDQLFDFIIRYRWLNFGKAPHLTLQAGVSGVKVEGKGVRVDALCWIPDSPAVQLVIECDSFEHHLNRESFIRDRQRDRVLSDSGYSVRRYTGKEIMDRPADIGTDLYAHLTNYAA